MSTTSTTSTARIKSRSRTLRCAGMLALASAFLGGCSAPKKDPTTSLGRAAIFDEVENALSVMDCTTAIETIKPLYNSADSDNTVRMKAAGAYGCHARVEFLQSVQDLASNASGFVSTDPATHLPTFSFWNTMAKLHSSTAGSDYVVEGAMNAMMALQTVVKPGAVVLPPYQVTVDKFNVGSVFGADRTDEANLYMIFMSMAAIGGVESRFGSTSTAKPDESNGYKKQQTMPWTRADNLDANACLYASAILNMSEAMKHTDINGVSLGTLSTALDTVLLQACDIGCKGVQPLAEAIATGNITYAALDPNGTWPQSGCSFTAGCGGCPDELRDPTRCLSKVDDKVSCAAAGIISLVNYSTAGWAGP